jgi:hypothetical protein
MIEQKTREYVINTLLDKGAVTMHEICSLRIEPARKGKIYGTFGHTPKNRFRVAYNPSVKLKKIINDELERRALILEREGVEVTIENLLKVV